MSLLEPLCRAPQKPPVFGLRSAHVIGGLEPFYGGPSYSVPKLCEALAAAGAEATLLSVAGKGQPAADRVINGYRDRRFNWSHAGLPVLRNLRGSAGLSVAIRKCATEIDIIHNHGLWLMPNVQAGWAATRAKKPIVISPRGMLSEASLAHSHRRKIVFWHLLQGPVMRRADCLHATSEQEYHEIRAFGLTNPVSVIPNGIDVPKAVAAHSCKTGSGRVILSLGRIHPKKGLDRLIRAWAQIEPIRLDWGLKIIGPSELGHREQLQALVSSLGLRRVAIEGPIYGEAKQAAYWDADLFVLPTLSENFGLTVGEALASGLPVIATKGAPWSGLKREECGWWIDQGVDPLAATLASGTAMPSDALRAMGSRGRQWVMRDFSWDRVAREMLDTYRWLKLGTEMPKNVFLD